MKKENQRGILLLIIVLVVSVIVLVIVTSGGEEEKRSLTTIIYPKAKEHQISVIESALIKGYRIENVYADMIQEGHYIVGGQMFGPGMDGDPAIWHLTGENTIVHVDGVTNSAQACSKYPKSMQLSIMDDSVADLYSYLQRLNK